MLYNINDREEILRMLYNTKCLKNRLVENLKEEVSKMETKPVLKVLLVGDNPASISYVTNKQKISRANWY